MRTRKGKIARLPREIRAEINHRLERSEPSPKLLAWLNALPEVRRFIDHDFAGVPISKQNLSEWRQGGFREWLAKSSDDNSCKSLPERLMLLLAEIAEAALVSAGQSGSKQYGESNL